MKYNQNTFKFYVGSGRRLRFQVIGRFYPLDGSVVEAGWNYCVVQATNGRKYKLGYSPRQKFGIFSVDEM